MRQNTYTVGYSDLTNIHAFGAISKLLQSEKLGGDLGDSHLVDHCMDLHTSTPVAACSLEFIGYHYYRASPLNMKCLES